MALEDDVRSLRERRLTPKQIAKQLKQPKARVEELIRALAESSAASSQVAPVYSCLVSPGWSETLILENAARDWLRIDRPGLGATGLVTVLVARQVRSQRFDVAVFLVDTWARGVKNAFGPERVSADGLSLMSARAFSGYRGRGISAPIALARALVFGAIEYARTLGFSPHPDFETARELLGEGPFERGIRFGRLGAPMLMSSPLDDELGDGGAHDDHAWGDLGDDAVELDEG